MKYRRYLFDGYLTEGFSAHWVFYKNQWVMALSVLDGYLTGDCRPDGEGL